MRRPSIFPDWDAVPIRGRIDEVYVHRATGEVVVLGRPEAEDETHNCDANGCGQDHVLARFGKR